MSTRRSLPPFLRRMLAQRLAGPAPLAAAPRHRRVCLYKVDALGDFVVALGALHHLVDYFGAAECRLVVSHTAAPLAAAEFPDVDRWEMPANASGVWRELRPLRRALAPAWAAESFEALVCLRHQRNLHRDLALTWLHATTWHGLGPRPSPVELALENRPVPADGYPASPPAGSPWCGELLAHRAVVAQATGQTPDWAALRPTLRSVTSTRGDALVFCPFGADAIRDYPSEHWIAALRDARLPPVPIQLLGPGARAADLHRLAAQLRGFADGRDVTVATDLPPLEFVHRIAAARAVLTVESAAAHLATALDKPAVILVGGGHFNWLAPWGGRTRQRWLTHTLPCFGCRWVCTQPTVRCLTELPASAVAAALREIFANA